MANAGSHPKVKWWKFYCMWQWTSTGRLDGYGHNLDCNVFYGDAATWDKYVGKSTSTAKPQTKPTPKTTAQLAEEVIAGQWGNGEDRKKRLTAAGYDYNAVQNSVNQKMAAKNKQASVYYTVKRGDTLSAIASKYGTTYTYLAQINGIADPNRIYPGQKIRVK
jgi:LysM repeat protein